MNILFSTNIPNYIPNKYVTIDDRDPPWMTEKIKNKINLKRSLSLSQTNLVKYKCYQQKFLH